MVLSKKKYLCKGEGEVWRNLEICAARKMKFQNLEDERGMDPPLVCGLVLFI